jgi:hypothetical protein
MQLLNSAIALLIGVLNPSAIYSFGVATSSTPCGQLRNFAVNTIDQASSSKRALHQKTPRRQSQVQNGKKRYEHHAQMEVPLR